MRDAQQRRWVMSLKWIENEVGLKTESLGALDSPQPTRNDECLNVVEATFALQRPKAPTKLRRKISHGSNFYVSLLNFLSPLVREELQGHSPPSPSPLQLLPLHHLLPSPSPPVHAFKSPVYEKRKCCSCPHVRKHETNVNGNIFSVRLALTFFCRSCPRTKNGFSPSKVSPQARRSARIPNEEIKKRLRIPKHKTLPP